MAEKKLNYLSREIKLISAKGLRKDLINGYIVLNGAKYFTENGSQNYLIFQPLLKYFEASRTSVNAKVMA